MNSVGIALAVIAFAACALVWSACRLGALADLEEQRLIADLRARGIIPMEDQ